MKQEKSLLSKIVSWIFIVIMIFVIVKLFGVFKTYYFNGFTKAEAYLGLSSFTRDSNTKYLNYNSYKIESKEFNDAAFYKEIEVEPNTAYRISCMVKTENVIPEEINTDGGANISLIEQVEISKSITGTNEWTKLDFCFNSQNRKTIKIGFRLGGNTGRVKGTAWFSNFKLEKGIKSDNNKWKVVCFILKNLDVNINGKQYNFSMSLSDIDTVRRNMERFKNSCKELSDKKMQVEYSILEINEPVKTISYSNEHGYYIDPYDVNQYIEDIVTKEEYDYIFVAARMGNENLEIPTKEWIGLR